MASSQEEGQIVADCVTNYYIVDSAENPISFSYLPLIWSDDEKLESAAQHAFLRGMLDDGSRKISRKVIAWKFLLSHVLPEIYLLLDGTYGTWIKLQTPLNSYQDTVRTVLTSLHCLHFLKNNSEEESGEALWKHITATFSTTYEVPPSENDLVHHEQWINEAALRDKDIAKAKILPAFLSEISGKRKAFLEENGTRKRPKLIVYEDDWDIDDSCDADEDELFDRVCALCDDGGDILCCEGRCIRSFHPTVESGAGSSCESLGYSSEEVYVFPCVSVACGHFYHPKCVSELVFPGDENQAQELQKQIQAGDSFTCPAHTCSVCKQGESKNVSEMQFAVCRRCPKAYHRKCLPSNIKFERDDANGIPQRAWEKLLTNRILIYCTDHKICRNILTPKRDHLLFPLVYGNKEQHPTGLPEESNVMSQRSRAYRVLTEEIEAKERCRGITGMIFSKSATWRKPNKPSTMGKIKFTLKSGKPVATPSMRGVLEKAAVENVPTKRARTLRTPEIKRRIQILIENSLSSFNVEEFLDEQRKCANASSPLPRVDKIITMGKVECSVEAIQAALKKLQERGTIEDAKRFCQPVILSTLIKWKKQLLVYLAPFIHGMRYTSFGRHFTKVDKLKEVRENLCIFLYHWVAHIGFHLPVQDVCLKLSQPWT